MSINMALFFKLAESYFLGHTVYAAFLDKSIGRIHTPLTQ